ncbi:MAG TPA: COX15/CtaA family protein [Candidatus Eisenbacteria bacterium]|jgi:heme A synthase
MSSNAEFRVGANLSLATTLLLFGLIVLGSVVRTTGSGLACPDWPLCQGRLLPPLQLNVLIEWFHRLFALLASVMLFATAGWVLGHRATRARLGGLAALALALLLVQVLLGALTVWKLLSPAVVSSHLAVALLLFATTLVTALAARSELEPDGLGEARPPALLAAFGIATAAAYAQSLLGGVVSTSHAGLACPDWPACNGRWLPPLSTPEGIQMLHRTGGYALVAAVAWAALLSRGAPDAGVRAGGSMALGLTLAQIALGVCNVLLGTPPWLSAIHLANAAAILAILLATTFRLARMPARAGGVALATSP